MNLSTEVLQSEVFTVDHLRNLYHLLPFELEKPLQHSPSSCCHPTNFYGPHCALIDVKFCLERGATGKGGKVILKIRKLNLRLLLRRENAVQRTPPRAHSAGSDYGNYTVLNWNADLGTFQRSSVQPTRTFSV